MEMFEELLEIGGPMILDELRPNEKVIAPEGLSETFNSKCPGTAFVEVSRRDAAIADLILLRDIGENTIRCCIGYLSRMGIVVFPQTLIEIKTDSPENLMSLSGSIM